MQRAVISEAVEDIESILSNITIVVYWMIIHLKYSHPLPLYPLSSTTATPLIFPAG